LGRGKLLRKIALELGREDLASRLWGRLEVIGDIAVLRKSPEVEVDDLRLLAEELIRRLKYVKSVWLAVSPVEGPHRVREYVHLAGEPRSTTIYKESGCLFKVDIRRVYISPALNYEHLRIANLVKPGETVINMFAGAGLFSIIIAKRARPAKVVSIDINPSAYELMRENIRLNKVEDVVEPVLGDAAEVIRRGYVGVADRVLMPLPELAMEYLPVAVDALKGVGWIHVYEFISSESPEDALREAEERYARKLAGLVEGFSIPFKRVVRSVGPMRYQVVLDIRVLRRF
jgi:tRNA (guanine37-N1)-methyltransferase